MENLKYFICPLGDLLNELRYSHKMKYYAHVKKSIDVKRHQTILSDNKKVHSIHNIVTIVQKSKIYIH